MGATLGSVVGVMIGGATAFSNPAFKGQRVAVISQTVLQMGGLFGLFLAVGSTMRGC